MRSTQIPQWVTPQQDLKLSDVLFKADLPEALGVGRDYVDNISGEIQNERYKGLAIPKPRLVMPSGIRVWSVREMELWLSRVQRARPGHLGRAYPRVAWDVSDPGADSRA